MGTIGMYKQLKLMHFLYKEVWLYCANTMDYSTMSYDSKVSTFPFFFTHHHSYQASFPVTEGVTTCIIDYKISLRFCVNENLSTLYYPLHQVQGLRLLLMVPSGQHSPLHQGNQALPEVLANPTQHSGGVECSVKQTPHEILQSRPCLLLLLLVPCLLEAPVCVREVSLETIMRVSQHCALQMGLKDQ